MAGEFNIGDLAWGKELPPECDENGEMTTYTLNREAMELVC